MGDISQIMINLGSADPSLRVPAEEMVNQARENDLAGFLVALVKELRDETKPDASRQMAGVTLKNSVAFDARDEARRLDLEAKWRQVPAETREYVKQELLTSLNSTKRVRLIVSLVIANLARIELPAGEWSNLITDLCGAVATGNPEWMETALTALGYICEECDGNEGLTMKMAERSSEVLNAIFQGLYHEVPEIKLNAVTALCNAIDFIGNNMNDDTQRRALIEGICATAAAEDPMTRQKALETLAVLARLYYEYLSDHVEQLWQVTTNAIRNDQEECGLQGLLFWLAISEVEVELEDLPTNQHYTSTILAQLFELLSQCLQRQEPDQTEDTWNIATAASKVLVALAEAVGDDIMNVAMPFVNANLGGDWRQREAAVLCFGCILHGPDPMAMKQVVAESLLGVCGFVSDQHPLVRDSALWTLSVIAAEFSDVVLAQQFLDSVLNCIAPTLRANSSMACRGAAVIHNLCLHYDNDDDDDGEERQSNELSPYYESMVRELLNVLDRSDVDDHMRHDTQEALNRLFGAAAPDVCHILVNLIPEILNRLNLITTQARNTGLTPEMEMSQGLLVGALNHICRKLKRQVSPALDSIVQGLTTMFDCSRDGSVLVEAIMCIGALGLATKEAFLPYLATFHRYIQAALQSADDYDLCASAIATIGDLATAVESNIAPMLPDTFNVFNEFLKGADGDRDLKAPMIHCLGDVALHAGGAVFQPYLDTFVDTVRALDNAARGLQAGYHAQEDEDFVGELWEAMLFFGTGLLQGFGDNLEPILPHLDYFLGLLLHAPQALTDDEDVMKSAVSLVGDMANVLSHGPAQYHAAAKAKLCTHQVQQLVQQAMNWESQDVSDTANWAMRELQTLSYR